MVSKFKIESVDNSNFTYKIEYQEKNEFKITIEPNITFSESYLLDIKFTILRAINPNENFYLAKNFVTLKLKPIEKLSNDTQDLI